MTKKAFQPGNQLAKGHGSGAPIGNRNATGEARKFLTQQLVARMHEPQVILKALLEMSDEDVKRANGKTIAAALVDKVVVLALKGDLAAAAFVWDRIEGKPTQRVEGKITFQWNLKNLSDKELDELEQLAAKAEVLLELQEDGTYAPRMAAPLAPE
jgi:hypothetical protein